MVVGQGRTTTLMPDALRSCLLMVKYMAFPYVHSTSSVQVSGSRFGFQLWYEDVNAPVFRGKIQASSGLNLQHLEFTCALHRGINSVA